jgi:hypothetical protein
VIPRDGYQNGKERDTKRKVKKEEVKLKDLLLLETKKKIHLLQEIVPVQKKLPKIKEKEEIDIILFDVLLILNILFSLIYERTQQKYYYFLKTLNTNLHHQQIIQ